MVLHKTIADFLGDRVVYRNLSPCDPALPKLADIWAEVGLERLRVPRKTESVYAAIMVRFLQTAQAQRGLSPLKRLLVIGDNLRSDGTAAKNLGEYLPMRCFIGGDKMDEAAHVQTDGTLMLANRWSALKEFLTWVQTEGITLDEQTALLLDLDKTVLGAKGRNDKVIDQARVTAVRCTVEELMGGNFDETAFRQVYDRLNQPTYHAFTGDNQDNLAYISLMVMGQLYPIARFWEDLEQGRLMGFQQFVTLCDARQTQMNQGLLTAHREVTSNLANGDPTPFKSFRYREYQATIALMNFLPDDTPATEVLAQEIVLTSEVIDLAEQLLGQGVLTFGLSDKPDEASIPPNTQTEPLHRMTMKVI